MHTIKPGLYAITNEFQGDELITAVTSALQGGANMLQYRDQTQDAVRRYHEASRLKTLCATYNVPLIINNDVLLAKQVAAAGVHLGKEDGSLADARALLGANAIIGVSCYNSLDLAQQAQQQGANYVAFGACFPSLTKPHATATDLKTIAAAREQLNLPIVAIGGITLTNAHQVLDAGAHSLAIIHDLFNAKNIKAQATALSSLIKEFNA